MIETWTGSVSTRQGALTLNVFYRKDARSPEVSLHIAERDRGSGITDLRSLEIINSGAKSTKKVWAKKRHNFPDGSFIKLSITRMKSGLAFGHSMHSIMLRARKTAPLYRLGIALPTDDNSSLSKLYIEGRFDLLTQKEVRQNKLHMNASGANDLATFDPSELKEFITIKKLEDEIVPREIPKPVVRESKRTGESKVLLKVRRTRNIRGG
jgi:hypothetical protein